ncbi:hypothetical protein AGLY_005940 [Aphis glycines]|uniref:Uncharacterized protein n=1 Tax=Aphis glycines TaxID=307491 RepID=A0A6G0TSB7_APHGL|nr:hypothetical protein AGLY_005940 [Aphis glycines]
MSMTLNYSRPCPPFVIMITTILTSKQISLIHELLTLHVQFVNAPNYNMTYKMFPFLKTRQLRVNGYGKIILYKSIKISNTCCGPTSRVFVLYSTLNLNKQFIYKFKVEYIFKTMVDNTVLVLNILTNVYKVLPILFFYPCIHPTLFNFSLHKIGSCFGNTKNCVSYTVINCTVLLTKSYSKPFFNYTLFIHMMYHIWLLINSIKDQIKRTIVICNNIFNTINMSIVNIHKVHSYDGLFLLGLY